MGRYLAFGCLNVRSLNNKLDDLLDVRRSHSLQVLLLVETWHDSDSMAIRRLRAGGFSVIERARPRRVVDPLSVNHGGVAIVAAPGIHLTVIDIGLQPSTFEVVASRVGSATSSCIVAVLYRPGSSTLTAAFYTEFGHLLDLLAVSQSDAECRGSHIRRWRHTGRGVHTLRLAATSCRHHRRRSV